MNFITKTLNRLFKSSNQLELNKIKPLVKTTNKKDKLIANINKLRSIGYKSKIDKINEKNFNI